jgi:hypothetical protein
MNDPFERAALKACRVQFFFSRGTLEARDLNIYLGRGISADGKILAAWSPGILNIYWNL